MKRTNNILFSYVRRGFFVRVGRHVPWLWLCLRGLRKGLCLRRDQRGMLQMLLGEQRLLMTGNEDRLWNQKRFLWQVSGMGAFWWGDLYSSGTFWFHGVRLYLGGNDVASLHLVSRLLVLTYVLPWRRGIYVVSCHLLTFLLSALYEPVLKLMKWTVDRNTSIDIAKCHIESYIFC